MILTNILKDDVKAENTNKNNWAYQSKTILGQVCMSHSFLDLTKQHANHDE